MASKKEMPRAPREPEETLRAIRDADLDDLVDAIDAMSPEEVARALDANGGDAAGTARRARAQVGSIQERAARLSWQDDARAKLDAHRATLARVRARRPKLSRDGIVARLKSAEADPRFAMPAMTFFRKRVTAEMTDAELEAMLDEVEVAFEGGASEGAEPGDEGKR